MFDVNSIKVQRGFFEAVDSNTPPDEPQFYRISLEGGISEIGKFVEATTQADDGTVTRGVVAVTYKEDGQTRTSTLDEVGGAEEVSTDEALDSIKIPVAKCALKEEVHSELLETFTDRV